MHLAPGRAGERHGEELQRGDEGCHEHGPEAKLGRLTDGLGLARALLFEVACERDQREAVEHRDAEEGDEADARGDREENAAMGEFSCKS